MAELEAALRTRLLAVTAAYGLTGVRIYPVRLPQNPHLPAITYRRVSGARIQGMVEDTGMPQPRIQIDCWADSYERVTELRAAVVAGLNRWSDANSTPVVLDVMLDNEIDFYEDDVASAEGEPFRRLLDFIVTYRE